ncbi:cytochrome P450 4c21-like [Battus philenor]|uniref:cytochrome P450 4c21-like n=1 Tax=Battus philenor TaxID=42288 RepID=UPI0035CFF5BC
MASVLDPFVRLMYWLVLTVVALVCAHVYLRVSGRRARKLLSHLPTYPTLPFLGNMHRYIGARHNTYIIYRDVSAIMEEKNLPFVLWMGNIPVIVLSDPDDIRSVGATFVEKPYIYKYADEAIRDGLFSAPGVIWKQNIKKLGGAFRGITVDAFMTIFNQHSLTMVNRLEVEVDGEPFDLLDKYLGKTTLETICETAFGLCDEYEITEEYINAIIRLQELFVDRSMNFLYHFEPIYRMSLAWREMKRVSYIINNFTEKVLEKRVEGVKAAKYETKRKLQDEEVSFKSFLDILLEMCEVDSTLTLEQIKAEMNTILIAGQETTAIALTYIMLMLGSNPRVQEKLYDEIITVCGDSDRHVCKEDLVGLSYCEAVICETLRLYPTVPGVGRLADRDLVLKSCTIPEGATCCINIWGAGRSRRLWGDTAAQYRSERWLSVNSTLAPPLLNFSTGRRACIGKQYAMCLMKTIIVYCVREMEFTSQADKMALKVDIAVRPVSGHLVQVRARNGDKQTCQTI